MDKIEVIGGKSLNGKIVISGAKNAALPIMAASILCSGTLELSNFPNLDDTNSMISLLENHGVQANIFGESNVQSGSQNRIVKLNAINITSFEAPYDIVRKMRASVLVLGPILARFGEAKVSLPGGCAIGSRPVDMHIEGLKAMGAEISIQNGYIHASASNGLVGAEIVFEKVSVGATENILMAATLAKGKTTIKNAAKEPEIIDLANCLIAMGAKISGVGTSELVIEGVKQLKSAKHSLVADRIEAGTYAIAAAITGGHIELCHVDPNILTAVLDKLEEVGISITRKENSIVVDNREKIIKPINITTSPYPDFPTDMQAQFMSLLTLAKGTSTIIESIFENRFMHVPELSRMGASIEVNDNSATVTGVDGLTGAEVMASDLRASVSLILAGLSTEGTTTLNRAYHLFRGYENLVGKLQACGADIIRVNEEAKDSKAQQAVGL